MGVTVEVVTVQGEGHISRRGDWIPPQFHTKEISGGDGVLDAAWAASKALDHIIKMSSAGWKLAETPTFYFTKSVAKTEEGTDMRGGLLEGLINFISNIHAVKSECHPMGHGEYFCPPVSMRASE